MFLSLQGARGIALRNVCFSERVPTSTHAGRQARERMQANACKCMTLILSFCHSKWQFHHLYQRQTHLISCCSMSKLPKTLPVLLLFVCQRGRLRFSVLYLPVCQLLQPGDVLLQTSVCSAISLLIPSSCWGRHMGRDVAGICLRLFLKVWNPEGVCVCLHTSRSCETFVSVWGPHLSCPWRVQWLMSSVRLRARERQWWRDQRGRLKGSSLQADRDRRRDGARESDRARGKENHVAVISLWQPVRAIKRCHTALSFAPAFWRC